MSTVSDSDARKTRVFLSYSRKDSEFAQALRDRLIADGFDAFLDTQDIVKGEPWRERLQALIFRSDSVLFVVSPDSVGSEICDWEINEAERLAKRVLPVVCRRTPDDDIPGRLKRLNYAFLDAQERWEAEYSKLCEALTNDIQWVREHTRLSELAAQWDRDGRPDGQLLRLDMVQQARRWENSRPPEADLGHLLIEFLTASEQKEARDHKRLVSITGRAYLKASHQALANGYHDAALRAAAAGIVLSEDVDAQFVPERRSKVLAAIADSRLRCALRGHTDVVSHASFSGDDSHIVTTSDDGSAKVWDARNGALVCTLVNPDNPIRFARLNRDGKAVVTTSADGTAQIWDSMTGAALARIDVCSSDLCRPYFTPDDKRILIFSQSVGHLVDAWTGAVVVTFRGHRAAISRATLSRNGRRVFISAADRTIRVWDVDTGRLLKTIGGRKHSPHLITTSADGNRLFEFTDRLTVWNAKTGRKIATRRCQSTRNAIYTSLLASPGGELALVASFDNAALLFEVGNTSDPIPLVGHSATVRAAAFSPDASRVVTAGDETARLWDARTGSEIAVLRGHTSRLTDCSFSSDGLRVLTASEDGTARIWDARTSQRIAILGKNVLCNDENVALCRGNGGEVRVWALDKPQQQLTLAHSTPVTTADVHSLTHRAVTATQDGVIQVWDTETANLVTVVERNQTAISILRFSHDGASFVSVSRSSTPLLWDTRSGQQLAIIGDGKHICSKVTFAPGDREIVLESESGSQLWDTATARPVAFPVVGTECKKIVVSPNGQYVATLHHNGETRIWWPDRTSSVSLPSLGSTVESVRFTADSLKLITRGKSHDESVWVIPTDVGKAPQCSLKVAPGDLAEDCVGKLGVLYSGNVATLIDLFDGRSICQLLGHEDTIWSAQFSRDGTRVLTTSEDSTVRIWRTLDGLPLLVLRPEAAVDRAFFCAGDKHVIVFAHDRSTLWDAEIATPLATADPDHWLAASLSYGRGFASLSEQSDPLIQSIGAENADLFMSLTARLTRLNEQASALVDAAVVRLSQSAHPHCYLAPSNLPGAIVPVRRNPYRTAMAGGIVGVVGGMLLLGGLIWLWNLLSAALR